MSLVESNAPAALTFILPTRNRRQWVFRAIESCLQVDRPECRVELLVVDGNSTDGSYEEIQSRYAADARVRLVRQQGKKGFMAACYYSVPMVKTPYATYMYDDDVLSPYWAEMPQIMLEHQANFVMGFSVEYHLEEVFSFERVPQRMVSPSALLRGYFGCGHDLSQHSLPYSPVCCLTRTILLKEVLDELDGFIHGQPLREYFMMQRNAGPDLMIYLLSIIDQRENIPLFDGPIAQLSAHEDSITSGLEPTDLPIGYWLGHVWLCKRLRTLNRRADAGWCAAYTVKKGLRLAGKRIQRKRGKWLGSLSGEIAALAVSTLFSACAASFLKSFLVLLLPRKWRPQFGL